MTAKLAVTTIRLPAELKDWASAEASRRGLTFQGLVSTLIWKEMTTGFSAAGKYPNQKEESKK